VGFVATNSASIIYLDSKDTSKNFFSVASFALNSASANFKPALTNILANSYSAQSSTLGHACNPIGAKAIDNNLSGVFSNCGCTATNEEFAPWWKADA